MFDALIDYAIRKRGAVLLAAAAMAAAGVYALLNLPIDALPDITNVQVMVLTDAPALGPEEVEQFLTIPIENAMNGIPRIEEVRSISQFGLSAVFVVFEEGTDIYWARQQVGERLRRAEEEIPPEFGRPILGPIATGLGEILRFEVRNADDAERPRDLMDLRTILDWEVARPLMSVPGVVEVNTFGGELKTYQVQVDPDRLAARNLSIGRVFEALRRNNGNAGGGYLERNGEVRAIRCQGLVRSLDEIRQIVLDTATDGTPIRVGDVGEVAFAPMLRQGAVTRDGRGEAVTGHRPAAGRRERPGGRRAGQGEARGAAGPAPRGRRPRDLLRPGRPDRAGHRDRRAQPGRGRGPGRGRPAGPAREPAGRPDRGARRSRSRCSSPAT